MSNLIHQATGEPIPTPDSPVSLAMLASTLGAGTAQILTPGEGNLPVSIQYPLSIRKLLALEYLAWHVDHARSIDEPVLAIGEIQ